MTSILQSSLTGGELAPSLHGRVDLARYQSSMKVFRNFLVNPYGGAKNRPGFRYVVPVKDSSKRSRLIPFQFSTTQTYVLEFGDQYLRVVKDGGQVVYSSGGSAGLPVEVATPYTTADLPFLTYTQSADVMTICHPAYQPRQLSRTAHDAWAMSLYAFKNGPFQGINTDTAKTVVSNQTTGTVTITATSAIFTAAKVGMYLYIEQKNFDAPWEVSKDVLIGNIRRSDGKYYQAQSAGKTGTLRPTHATADVWSDGGVDWLYLHPAFGIARIDSVAGNALSCTATVLSQLPNESSADFDNVPTHKWAFGAWGGDQGWPSCVTYHQQRQVFGATPAQPETLWMTRIGAYTDFGKSSPVLDDDQITNTLGGTQVNAIRGLLPLQGLVVFTSGGVQAMGAGSDDVLTPSNQAAKGQSSRGSSTLQPLAVGDGGLYLQDKGKVVRAVGYEFAKDRYTGPDLTVMASHLVAGKKIEEWAWLESPHGCAFAVRNDGVLLSITYMAEQEVIGWARHDTDGFFESVAVVSEGDEDVLYAIIRRTIQGQTKRYIERMETRVITDIRQAFFVDSGLSYDGRNTTSTTVTLSGGTNWDHTETLTCTSSAPIFVGTSDVGDMITFEGADGKLYKLRITTYTSTTSVQGILNKEIPAEYRNAARADWAFSRDTFSGLGHLEGKTVAVLADGNVESEKVVTGGKITLSNPAFMATVGLPIVADLQTLRLTLQTPETVIDKKKNVTGVSLLVDESRSIWAGRDFDHLYESKPRTDEGYDQPAALQTGVVNILVSTHWEDSGSVCIRQTAPLPITVLAVIPDIVLGGK